MKHENKLCLRFTVLALLLLCIMAVENALPSESRRNAALNSTVLIETNLGFRSGFFIEDNVIVTNYHVLHGAHRIAARHFATGTGLSLAENAIAINPQRDLAVLRVTDIKVTDIGGTFLSPVDNDSIEPQQRVWVYAAVNRKGDSEEGSLVEGKIRGTAGCDSQEFFVKAPVRRRSSGGPVLNEYGEVIGVSLRGVVDVPPIPEIPLGWVTRANHLNSWREWEKVGLSQIGERPINSCVLISLANVKLEEGYTWDAINLYDKVIDESGYRELSAYFNQAMAKYRMKKIAEAVDDLRNGMDTSTFRRAFKAVKVGKDVLSTVRSILRSIL